MHDTTQKMEIERHGTIRNNGGIIQFNTISEHLNISHHPKTGCRAVLHGPKRRDRSQINQVFGNHYEGHDQEWEIEPHYKIRNDRGISLFNTISAYITGDTAQNRETQEHCTN